MAAKEGDASVKKSEKMEQSDSEPLDAYQTDTQAHLRAYMKGFTRADRSNTSLAEQTTETEQRTPDTETPAVDSDTQVETALEMPLEEEQGGCRRKKKKDGSSDSSQPKKAQLGTLFGVYLPSIQNVFGILMFLRLSWCVGTMGVWESFFMVFLCCLLTFLTSISVSAIATNGKLGNGGPYYLISRSLGAEMGAAVGLLFCLANTIAIAMYLLGGTEIMLFFLLPPEATIGGKEAQTDLDFMGMGTHNLRIYSTGLLILVFLIVIVGVRFTQMMAPLSLVCVLVSILSIYVGMVQKTIWPGSSPYICLTDGMAIFRNTVMPLNISLEKASDFCQYCAKSVVTDLLTANMTTTLMTATTSSAPMLTANVTAALLANTTTALYDAYCGNVSGSAEHCQRFMDSTLECVESVPGLTASVFWANTGRQYMSQGEAKPGVDATMSLEIPQDLTTSFFVLLSIYFPSVTGIMTGCNISGDLKKPQKSIPRGTISAQVSTSIVYLTLVLAFGGCIRGEMLRDKYGWSTGGDMSAALLSWPIKYLVLVGAFCSTFGAALQSLCCAPRLLQAIAHDEVIPLLRPLSVVTRCNEPLRGQLLLAVAGFLTILIGKLDYVAPLVQLCFLTCYFSINLSCAAMSALAMPSWRPNFKYYHPLLSVLGVLLSLFLMFSNYWWQSILLTLVGAAIYAYVALRGHRKEWGDARRGIGLTLADDFLFRRPDDVRRCWRPMVMVVVRGAEDAEARALLRVATCIDAQLNIVTRLMLQTDDGQQKAVGVAVTTGAPPTRRIADVKREERGRLRVIETEERLAAYTACLAYTDAGEEGAMLEVALATTGLGRLCPNTVLAQWPTTPADDGCFWRDIFASSGGGGGSSAPTQQSLLVLLRGEMPEPNRIVKESIDVWWIMDDGDLMLYLATAMINRRAHSRKRPNQWRDCRLRLFVVAIDGCDDAQVLTDSIHKWLHEHLIPASLTTVVVPADQVTPYLNGRVARYRNDEDLLKSVGMGPKQRGRQGRIVGQKGRGSRDDVPLGPQAPGAPPVGSDLNSTILSESDNSELVFVNAPRHYGPDTTAATDSKTPTFDYCSYLTTVTGGLKRAIIVRGSGREVITEFK